jgi:hypothetical protein
MRRISMYLFVLLLFPLPLLGALSKPRPYGGSGALIMRPVSTREDDNRGLIVLYREPGVGRLKEQAPSELPLLAKVLETGAGEYPAAVLGKRGNWLKIAYDDGGREGWLEMERRWDYITWEELFPKRSVRLLPGLKRDFGAVRQDPSPTADVVAAISPETAYHCILMQGDWLQVSLDPQTSGWLRWRDENGRFLITVTALPGQ